MGLKHISMDLESWGTEPGDDLRSLGAVVFDPDSRLLAYPKSPDACASPLINNAGIFYAALDNPLIGKYSDEHFSLTEKDKIAGPFRTYNLSRKPATVEWWHTQQSEHPNEFRAAFANPIDLREALLAFKFFVLELSDDVRDEVAMDVVTWSHGAAFDPGLLIAAYAACGIKYPLHYRAPRDTRTIFDDACIADHGALLKKHRYGTLHHALHDAISQARAITEARQVILGWKQMSEAIGDFTPEPDEKPVFQDIESAARFYSSRILGTSKSEEVKRLVHHVENVFNPNSERDVPLDSLVYLFMKHRLEFSNTTSK